MKNPIHRLALYTATILISAMPFTADAADANEKTKKQPSAVVKVVKTIHEYHRNSKHKA